MISFNKIGSLTFILFKILKAIVLIKTLCDFFKIFLSHHDIFVSLLLYLFF